VNDDEATRAAREHLRLSSALTQAVAEQCLGTIITAAGTIAEALRAGGKLLLCGNGGSAADCQHMAGELVNRLSADFPRPGLPAVALTTDTSVLTALSNDVGFEAVFARQVQALGRPGDVLLAISTSGTSPNVLRAVEAARRIPLATIALTGMRGRLNDMVDVVVAVPSEDVQHIQEAHLAIEHILCYLVERQIFREAAAMAAPPAGSDAYRD
jgi:D-sedoheptulose 7-phosphate isomerase